MNAKDIRELINKEGPLILEIGAHIGVDTGLFLQEFKDIKLFCFEPDPRCIRLFKSRIKDDRCTLIESAVSNSDGRAMLHLSFSSKASPAEINLRDINIRGIFDFARSVKQRLLRDIFKKNADSLGQSSIKRSVSKPEDVPWLLFERDVEVETVKLDSFIKRNGISFIDFIWSDVQGAEKDLIEGAVNTLKITKYFYCEYGARLTYPEALTREETAHLMRSHNFELVENFSDKAGGGNLLFVNRKLT